MTRFACGETRNAYAVLAGGSHGKQELGKLSVDDGMILKICYWEQVSKI